MQLRLKHLCRRLDLSHRRDAARSTPVPQPRSRRSTTQTKSARTSVHTPSVVYVPFQQPLPPGHPFINAPVQVPQTVPLTTNTQAPSELQKDMNPSTPKKSDVKEYVFNDLYHRTFFKTPSKEEAVARLRGMNKNGLRDYARNNGFTIDKSMRINDLRAILVEQTMNKDKNGP